MLLKNTEVNLLNINKLAIITFCCLCLTSLVGQNNSFGGASDGAKGYQMEVTKGNLTSFSKVENKKELWARFNTSESKNHPEFGKNPYNAKYNGYVEVLNKRTIDERYFVNEQRPSEFKIQKGINALHYKVNGDWVTIDHRLADKGNGIFEATNQYDPVGVDVNKSQTYIKTPQGQISFNNWKLFGETNEGQEQFIATANWSNYSVGDDGVYITDVFPGIDAQMVVNRGSIKTSFVVKQLNYGNFKNLLFKDAFSAPMAAYLNFENAISNDFKAKSGVDLLIGGKPVLEIGEATAYPENGSKEDYLIADYSINATHLTIIIPVNWIQSHISSKRVIIDPLVSSSNSLAQASITGSMYNASCGFTNSCNYNLSVNTPANSTLTNVLWSFNYITGGVCWLSDGAVRFTSGACTSPSNAAFYWYCNSATGGTCTGNNISIWNDVRTCMPAPSCAPVSVPFTMQFFRKCYGAVGCSGTCIGANSPWTMTLEGRTVEFTNVPNPFSLASPSVCAGNNMTATSNGTQYGVGPYSLNWSFSPTGIPSVGTGVSPSINYPTAGTVTLYCIVTDACGITATVSKTVNVVPIPTANAGTPRNLTCTQTTTLLGGSGGGTYSWTGPGTITNPTSANPTVNSPGTFSLVVNVAGCNSPVSTVAVTQNTTAPVTTAGTSGSVTCSNNTISLTSSTGGLTYTWTAPAGSSITGGVNNQNTTGSGPGTYTIRVTNSVNGCTNIATVAANVNQTITPVTASTTGSVTCTNSVIALNSTPSTGVTYTWTAPGGSSITGGVNNQNTTGSGAGTYTVKITNSVNGCTNIATVAANVNTTAPTTTAGVAGLVTCSSPTVSLTSGPSGMSYTWTAPGGSSISGGVNNQNTTGTGGGTYSVIVQNPVNGCSTSSVVTASTNTTLPSPSITAPSTITCANPTITLNGNPGAGVTYTWSGPGTVGSVNNQTVNVNQVGNYTLVVTNSTNGCTNSVVASVGNNTIAPTITPVGTQTITCATPSVQLIGSANPSTCTVVWTGGVCAGATSYTATACAAGTYTYIATNPANGCQSAAQVATVVPNAGVPSVTVANTGTITCTTTNVQVIGTTTTSPATYVWSGPGIVSGAGTPTITVNQSGVYSLTVTNTLNGCTSVVTNSITANNAAVTPTTSSSTTITCTNPTSTLTTNAGAGTYTYNWSGPGIVTSNTLSTITSSLGGVYNVTVTNTNNGCVGIGTVSVASSTTVPSGITISPSSFTLSCATPTTQIIAGSTGGTTYSWTAPGTGAILSGGSTPTVSIQGAGVYSVVITGTNGCSAPVATSTMIADVNSPNVTLSSPNLSITCTSTAPGLTLTPTGTVAIASYSWSPASGISSGSNTTTPTFTAAGTYTCLITATNGCTITATVPVTNNTVVPTANTPTIANISCASTSVDINPSYTPSTGLTYTWTGTGIIGSANNSSVTVNQSGTYTVTMLDPVNGCSNTAVMTVNGNTVVPTVTVTSSSSIGIGCLPTNTAVTLDASTTPSTGVTYTWNTTATTQSISVSTPGVYTVTVTDAVNGCQTTGTISVANNSSAPTLTMGTTAFIPCGGVTTTVNLTGNSSDVGVTFSWTGPGIVSGAGNDTTVVNAAGNYTLTVTNPTTGCVATGTVNVINSVPTASFTPDVTSGFAPLTVNFTNNSSNANNFSWTFNNGSAVVTTTSVTQGVSSVYNSSGSFTVMMVASSGVCSDTAYAVIVVQDGFNIEVPNVFTPNDDNINDVFTITSTGVKEITLKIFNRWGQLMYDFSGPKASWDGITNAGQKASIGTYFFFIKATGFDGKEYEKNGPVSLFR